MLRFFRVLLSPDIRRAVRLLRYQAKTSSDALASAEAIRQMPSYPYFEQLKWLRAACLIEGMSMPDLGAISCTEADLSCFDEPEIEFSSSTYDENFRLPSMPKRSSGLRFLSILGRRTSGKLSKAGPQDNRTITLTDLAVEALYLAASKSADEALREKILSSLPRLPGVDKFRVIGELYRTNVAYTAQTSREETEMYIYATGLSKALVPAYHLYRNQLVDSGHKVKGKEVDGGRLVLCLFSSWA